MDRTLSFYNNNAHSFIARTVAANVETLRQRFIKYIPPNGYVLDFGCGSGRDTRYFLEKGYHVVATDGSEELCKVASAYTGVQVRKLLFQELQDENCYDGIWACSSILHVGRTEQPDIFRRMILALKEQGYIYTSFKYGTFEGFRGERYFTDFDEAGFRDFIRAFPELTIEKMWVTSDVRPERSNEKWLNIILRKSIIS